MRFMQLYRDPEAIAPERAIVFKIASSVTQFCQEANRIGLVYLGDDELVIDPDDDFRHADQPEEQIAGGVYLAMPNLNFRFVCEDSRIAAGIPSVRRNIGIYQVIGEKSCLGSNDICAVELNTKSRDDFSVDPKAVSTRKDTQTESKLRHFFL